MKIKNNILLFCSLFTCLPLLSQSRIKLDLETDWRFSRQDSTVFSSGDYNDKEWQKVTVPHDWAIYGPFDREIDKQVLAIVQDGQESAIEHTGRTGGLPIIGQGWYRKQLPIPSDMLHKKAFLLFDGAMSNAQVYVNGKSVGNWPNGYNSFWFDITDFLDSSSKKNQLAVRLENSAQSSRWYSGAGLYRNVHLLITSDAYIPIWGTYIKTESLSDDLAYISSETDVVIPEYTQKGDYILQTQILDSNGVVVADNKSPLSELGPYQQTIRQNFIIKDPEPWSVKSPSLYKAYSTLYYKGEVKDTYTTKFGIRTIEVIPDKGFYINGEPVKFQGVCKHHDLGPLGAAMNKTALQRQLLILKDMGCNAIRSSHNMPSPELVDLCDSLGIMLMAESFDEWDVPKMENGYNRYFNEWAHKDLKNLIRRCRNSPSVVMWCIGNEVPNQNQSNGCKVASMLQNICHHEDPTRPVVQGMDNPYSAVYNNFAAVMDIPGFNYRPHLYQTNYERLPQGVILGSETASTVSSRGIYKFPVTRKSMVKYDDHHSSSYDLECCSWGNLPEDDFIQHDDLPYCMGEFVWSGFDYLGEPSPYYSDWPSHSSLFGIVDLAGIPKDRYYLYRSHWNKDAETLHILPHWNWTGHEGEKIPVFVYTNYPSAEIFINGKSYGKKTKNLSVNIDDTENDDSRNHLLRQERYRLMWMDTVYEPGTVTVVAYDENGNVAAKKVMHTAGKPHHIELTPECGTIKANGKDLAFINVKMVDRNGNLCPNDSSLVKFTVEGQGTFKASANGDPTCLDLFHIPQMHLFSGQLTLIVQSSDTPGKIKVKVKSPGVHSASTYIKVK